MTRKVARLGQTFFPARNGYCCVYHAWRGLGGVPWAKAVPIDRGSALAAAASRNARIAQRFVMAGLLRSMGRGLKGSSRHSRPMLRIASVRRMVRPTRPVSHSDLDALDIGQAPGLVVDR
jgi:hypothetical protein